MSPDKPTDTMPKPAQVQTATEIEPKPAQVQTATEIEPKPAEVQTATEIEENKQKDNVEETKQEAKDQKQ